MDIGKLKLMGEASALLDAQLRGLGRVVLNSGGRVSMDDAKLHAGRQYGAYKAAQTVIRHQEADRAIAEIKATQKSIKPPK